MCRRLRVVAYILLGICSVAQCVIDSDPKNLVAVALILAASWLTFATVVRASVVRRVPVPAFIVLGYNISYLSGALFFKTIQGDSLVELLKVPFITFPAAAAFQVSLLFALVAVNTKALIAVGQSLGSALSKPLGLFKFPSVAQLWIMGLIGSVTVFLVRFNNYNVIEEGDASQKALLGVSFLAFVPYLIPLLQRQRQMLAGNVNEPIGAWLFVPYTMLILLEAIIFNTRAVFVQGFANLVFAFVLFLLLGQIVVAKQLRRRLTILVMVLAVLMPALSDLALAMVVVRSDRSDISSTELLKATLKVYGDKQALEKMRKELQAFDSVSTGTYDEKYFDNPFLNRFITIKYADNMLSLRKATSGDYSSRMWGLTFDKLTLLLPDPALKALGVDIVKKDYEYSVGDALWFAENGTGLGGYRVGSPIAHGLAIMGVGTFLFVIPLFVVFFIVMQSLTANVRGIIVVSPVVLMSMMTLYQIACGDSLISPVGMILRELPQSILIYLVASGLAWIGTLLLPLSWTGRKARAANVFHPAAAQPPPSN